MAGKRLALLLLLLALVGWTGATLHDLCDPFTWDENRGEDPLLPYRGKVVMVALMKGFCGYCIYQAAIMERMSAQLRSTIMPDLQMVIVNGGERHSADNINNINEVVSFPVLQDSPDNYMYNQAFDAQKDTVLIYDRCGQRAFVIPFPYSNLRFNITQRLLRRTYLGYQLCYCNLDPRRQRTSRNRHNMMYGDAPSVSDGDRELQSAAARFNFLDCSETDFVCQRFRNIFRRMHLNNGIGSNQDANLGIFTDQSDFNIESAGRGFVHSETMDRTGSGSLRGRSLQGMRRNNRGIFNPQ